MFNMFVMRRDLFNQYCSGCSPSWRKLEKRVDISDYDTYEARIYGFVVGFYSTTYGSEANNMTIKICIFLWSHKTG